MRDHSPLSPEERRKRLATMRAAFGTEVEEKLKPRLTAWEVVKRVSIGVYNDGFIHAGNLAYLAICALFPFFIVAAAVAHLLGQSQDAMLTVTNVLRRLPPDVAGTLREPIDEVLTVQTGSLLWFGALVGLWTATSFVETIRDILRRAYGVKYCAPFWEYRLGSILLILGAVLLLMIAFTFSAALTIAHHFIMQWFPLAQDIGSTLGLYRLVPAATLFFTFYVLFFALTPARSRTVENASTMLKMWFAPMIMRSVNPARYASFRLFVVCLKISYWNWALFHDHANSGRTASSKYFCSAASRVENVLCANCHRDPL